jgi:hypothetical protein
MRDPRAMMTLRAIFTSSSFLETRCIPRQGTPRTLSGDPRPGDNSDVQPTSDGVGTLHIGAATYFQELAREPKMAG